MLVCDFATFFVHLTWRRLGDQAKSLAARMNFQPTLWVVLASLALFSTAQGDHCDQTCCYSSTPSNCFITTVGVSRATGKCECNCDGLKLKRCTRLKSDPGPKNSKTSVSSWLLHFVPSVFLALSSLLRLTSGEKLLN